jgi:biotin carboxyl carrier protein
LRRTHTVAAERVGGVAAVVAHVGDNVGPADILVILESMKMEIPVLAEVAGVVTELAVSVGDVVYEGDVIAVIGPTVDGGAAR